jgi:hypothetical protein
MRCVLPPLMTRIARCARYALPIVLIVAVAPTAVAQSLVCHPIRRGESASEVARRVTGSSRNTYQTWFQIRNASSRFVPKSQYNRIRAGWHACVMKPAIQSASYNANRLEAPEADTSEASESSRTPQPLAVAALATVEGVEAAADGPQPFASGILRGIWSVDLTMVWLGAAMVVPWFGWRILDDHLVRLKTASIVMQHFADRFVHEFERPLARYDAADRPVRARLRCSARRRRIDILLAPGQGRRYPNLSDHKKNVEYDVARVIQVLADESFVSGPLSTHAEWVVVPFRFKAGPKHKGVACISSL